MCWCEQWWEDVREEIERREEADEADSDGMDQSREAQPAERLTGAEPAASQQSAADQSPDRE